MCYLYNFNPFEVIRLVASLQLAVLYPQSPLLIYCLLSDIILYFLLVAGLLGSKSTSLSSGFSDVIKAARYDLLIHCLIS